MKKESLKVSDELLRNLSIEQIADLKVDADELLDKLDTILEICDEALNS